MRKIVTISCQQGAVRAVRFNADGEYCLTCGSDKTVKLWNPYKPLLLQTYSGHGYEVLDVVGSSDSSSLASAGMDKAVFLWDVTSGQIMRRFRGHAAQINCLKYNEDSSIVLSGSVDGKVMAWDIKSKARDPVQILTEATDSVTSLSVSGFEIATGSLDGKVRRYDLRKGELNVDDVKSSVGSICFTADGQCILVNCHNSSVKLLDKDSGEILAEFKGHTNKKYRIDGCLFDNDKYVLSGSEDGHVYMWSLMEGALEGKLPHPGHRVVHSLSNHPKRTELLTATEGFVYLWAESEEDKELDGQESD